MENYNFGKNKWQIFRGSDLEWDETIKFWSDSSYLSGSKWASHLVKNGWNCKRWVKETNIGKSYIQSFYKKFLLNSFLIWIPDGIIGEFNNLDGFQNDIKSILKFRFCYLQIRFHRIFKLEDEINLFIYKWQKSDIKLSSDYKIILKTDKPLKEIEKGFSRNWKRSLKKFDKKRFTIEKIKDHKIVSKIYKEMKNIKLLRKKNIYSELQCKSIIDSFANNLLVFAVKDEYYNFISLRGVIINNKKIFDIFAASNYKGRQNNSSHAILYEIIKMANFSNIKEYDLANIDPQNNIGVFNFKKGTGGDVIKTLGEFEWSNHKIFNLIINMSKVLIKIR